VNESKKVSGYGFRKFLTQFISMKTAAFVHCVLLKPFIRMVEKAIEKKNSK